MKWVVAGALALSASMATADSYMTFSNAGAEKRGGTYTTRGGCTAYRPPEVQDKRIQGVGSLRFLESAYIHHVAEAIEAAGGQCTCELRFPAWDAAVQDLEERFDTLPDDESSAWVYDYARKDGSRLTREVMQLCKAQGVY